MVWDDGIFVIRGDLTETLSPVFKEGLMSMREMVTKPSDRFLKCLSSKFVFRNPMLCFESSKDIVLKAGSDVFTEDVGVNIGILNTVSVDCFCAVCEGISYRNMNDLYQTFYLIYL